MSLKEETLNILLDGEAVSGEALASRLSVTRAAVWKAIRSLKEEGYDIVSLPSRGYRLIGGNIISETELRRRLADLDESLGGLRISTYKLTDSTNRRAMLWAEENPDSDGVFIADGQTEGRGRLGRCFSSPQGAGLYMSLLLHPKGSAEDAVKITAYTAVAVCRAIERLTELHPTVKWVNDIYLSGRKAAGILTQGNIDMETGQLRYAIVGIGINVLDAELGGELTEIATSLEAEGGGRVNRCSLAAAIIAEMYRGIDSLSAAEYREEYRSRSFLIGRDVDVIREGGTYPARVLDITDDYRLRLLTDDGEELLSTGEVSVRAKSL